MNDYEQEDNDSFEAFMANFESEWENFDLGNAKSLFSEVDTSGLKIIDNAYLQKWYAKINIAVFPFHHLIPASKLIPHSVNLSQTTTSIYNSKISDEYREQLYWQSLAANGISANEAILLDSIRCSFTDFLDDELINALVSTQV